MRLRATGIAAAATILAVMIWGSAHSAAAAPEEDDSWAPLRFLVGAWEGTSEGRPGQGRVAREYRFTLKGRYLEVRNRTVYPPQEKNVKGEEHEEIGYISLDRWRMRFVFRQFHSEGFVNQYVADSLAAPTDSLVWRSEAIENIAYGWRAREIYKILGPDEFVERFELARPGGEFSLYSETRLRRKK